jgi:7,8-dihydropterin-6-yl-methyl-4-(beta-D-ribofuranosyl)aminobenzene 5'-phosphate synthase
VLAPVDRVQITVVIDNFLDVLMAGEQGVVRYLARDFGAAEQLVAEHGFSALVTIDRGTDRQTVLYDAGLTPHAVARNLDVLEVPVGDLRAIVISHGHADHHGGLEGLLRRRGRSRLPLVIHPDAWRERRVVFPSGVEVRLPPPNRHDLEAEGLEVVEERAHSMLLDGSLLVSGQIERVTDFEVGFPIHEACNGGGWQPDPMIWDDQALIVDVRGLGLVILSGCSHAGVINVVKHAQRLTGNSRIAGLIGGLHLTGGLFESRIGPTVEALRAAAVARVLPAHCSGWRAVHAIARALPDAFVQSAVGTTVTFESPANAARKHPSGASG